MKITKKTLSLMVVSAVVLLLLGSNILGNARAPITAYGTLDEGLLIAYGSSSYAPNHYSGREWTGYGRIESIGWATVEISAAWDWYSGGYPSSYSYSADHPGALVVVNPVWHIDTKDETTYPNGPFECSATVTITDSDGDQIDCVIMSGSVYELEAFGWHTSINEWLISFKIVGGTGRYSEATGTGIYKMIWQSGTHHGNPPNPEDPYLDTGYVDPRRFIQQEIFLTYIR